MYKSVHDSINNIVKDGQFQKNHDASISVDFVSQYQHCDLLTGGRKKIRVLQVGKKIVKLQVVNILIIKLIIILVGYCRFIF